MNRFTKLLAAAALSTPGLFLVGVGPSARADEKPKPLRPPAVPLVTFNPYLSIWSEADHLTDAVTKHWTHHPNPLVSLIRIDGAAYRLMGDDPSQTPALEQTSVTVYPTRTIYEFDGAGVHVTMTFTTTALPDDLDALAQPLSYINWDVRSTDGKAHEIRLYDSASGLLTVNVAKQVVEWSREKAGPLTALKIGTVAQTLLSPMGDDTRIDWGYAYLAADASQSTSAIGANEALLEQFVKTGALPAKDDESGPRPANKDQPVLAVDFDLGKVEAQPVSRRVIVAYDEIYSIRYFGEKLRPYWRRNGATPAQMLESADRDYAALSAKCAAFDKELDADAARLGGERYAQIAALAYRQTLAACGLAADANGQPLLFTKENTSNGDLATVDVFYPMDPIWVLLSPTLAKASLVHVLEYSASPHWKFPNAPHDLGTYPVAMGRDEGGEGMPVEESGNMILLCDAIAHADGKPDFVAPWWPQLTQWADYLEKFGLDPENQLCTDDFMGHLAHNANLSVKAILGLAAYGDLCRMRGDAATADRFAKIARADAEHWVKVADAGDHSLLAFDKPGTWSQKYNLVWDRILGLNVFPPEVAKKEIAFYKTVMQQYGVPLDSRTKLTKTDWSVWSATMATKKEDFETLVNPIWDYLDQTTARDPLADSYVTNNIHSGGMHARPVVGGIFVRMLSDEATWHKWASRDHAKVGDWAPLPGVQKYTEVIPTSRERGQEWRYTETRPGPGWTKPDFSDAGWKTGAGPFASAGTPGIKVGTSWKSDDIWLRREVTVPADAKLSNLQAVVYHDEDVDVYIDGIPAVAEAGFDNNYELLDISANALAKIKPGAKLTLAVHCHQTEGGQGIDVGIVSVQPAK